MSAQSMFLRLVSCYDSRNRSLIVDLFLDYGVNVNKYTSEFICKLGNEVTERHSQEKHPRKSTLFVFL